MAKATFLQLFFLVLCLFADWSCAKGIGFIDMTYPLEETTLHWPGNTPFNFTRMYKGPYGKLPWLESNDFKVAEHLGTHMDAPAHVGQGKWHLSDIPVDRFVGPAVVIDIKEKAAKNKDAQVTVDDLKKWEEKNGKIPDGSILLMNSGWGKFWGNRTLFRGNDTDDYRYMHFPGFHGEAAKWLVNNRNLKGVGVDTLSLDYGQSDDIISHQIFFNENIFGLEMVANLDMIPAKGATLYVLPMKIVGGSGGATRILAVTSPSVNSGQEKTFPGSLLTVFLFFSFVCVY